MRRVREISLLAAAAAAAALTSLGVTARAADPVGLPPPLAGNRPLSESKSDATAEAPRAIPEADDLSAPRLPAPFILPELSHARLDAGLTWTAAMATPDDPSRASSTIAITRLNIEERVGRLRRAYIGLTAPLGLAALSGTGDGSRSALGNLEAHVRVVFPMPSWLAMGAVLGVVVPTALFDRHGPAARAAAAATSLEPTEGVHMLPGVIAFRPAFDVRLLRGPFVLQARQGLDIVVDSSGATSARTQGRILAHAGLLASRAFEVSVEGSQIYFFDSIVNDDDRTALTIGPGVRLSMGDVDVGASAITNLYAPLDGAIDRFFAIRLSLLAHL